MISPIGNSIPEFSENLKKGVCGKSEIRGRSFWGHSFEKECPSQDRPRYAFEVRGFDSRKHNTRLLDPFIQYAVAATAEAVRDSGADFGQADPYRIGISVSSSKGGVSTLDRFKDRFLKNSSAILGARIYVNSVPNFAAQWIARRWKVKGPARCYVAACATGTVAIIEGARMVADGTVDYCIAGASDASIVPLMLAGYRRMKALAESDIRPFDKRRDGFLVGEGAGIVVLESLENARARGAKIYGEILGHAYGTDASHALRFDEKEHALSRTIRRFFEQTGLEPGDIDYVNLHGTGTESGDLYETREVRRAFGPHAHEIPMSATKSMVGHMLGASGAVELIASILAAREGFLPPTVNLEKPDPECDLDYVPQKSRPHKIQTALSVSMGFGGHVAVIGVGKM